MNRKLSDWASIAEIIAAIGVIFSLIFVGLQINEGNVETRAATIQATLNSEMTFQSEILRYAETWEKVATGAPVPEGVETRRGIILYNLLMTQYENRYHQVAAGYVEGLPENLEMIVALPFYEVWRASIGANARSATYLAMLDDLRDKNSVQ